MALHYMWLFVSSPSSLVFTRSLYTKARLVLSTVALKNPNKLADLTVSKRPGTSDRIEIHFAIFIRLYLLFSFMKLVET